MAMAPPPTATAPSPPSIHQSQIDALQEDALKAFASKLGTQSLGSPDGSSDPSAAAFTPSSFAPGTAAAAAAKRLGLPSNPAQAAMMAGATSGGNPFSLRHAAGGGRNPRQPAAKPELVKYLLRDDTSFTGGAIVSLPGLDLKVEDDDASGTEAASITSASSGGSSFGGGGGMGGMGGTAGIFPGIGMSHKSSGSMGMDTNAGGGARIPQMAASVFSSHGKLDGAAASATAAHGVRLNAGVGGGVGQGQRRGSTADVAAANADAARLEQAAARNLGRKTTWTRSSAPQAPPQLMRNLSSSFASLVDSRVRAWTLLLLRHSLSSGDDASRSRLLALLATGASINMTAMATTFQTLDLPAETKAALEKERRKKRVAKKGAATGEGGGSNAQQKENSKSGEEERDVVLPLVFEAIIDVTIQGQQVTVNLRAPGTVSADFTDGPPLITYADVNLDANALVTSMVEQARLVVFKAVAAATALPTAPGLSGLKRDSSGTSSSGLNGVGGRGGNDRTSSALSQFGSALNLSHAAANPNESIRKASQSAQRLSDLLHGKTRKDVPKSTNEDGSGSANADIHQLKKPSAAAGAIPGGGLLRHGEGGGGEQQQHSLDRCRKQRSVTWNHPVEDPKGDSSNLPDPKRRKLGSVQPPGVPGGAPPARMKRSNKSFGKPDADIFENARNATFAEFGHAHKHSNVPTFVNGRLQVPNNYAQGGGSGGRGGGGGDMGNAGFGNLSSVRGGGNSEFGLQRRAGQSMGTFAGAGGGGGGLTLGGNASFANAGPPGGRGGLGLTSALGGQSIPRRSSAGTSMSMFGLERRTKNYGDMSRGAERRGSAEHSGGGGGGGASLPRTPTQLENMLLSHARGRGGMGR